jgi:hypothetical protein
MGIVERGIVTVQAPPPAAQSAAGLAKRKEGIENDRSTQS